MSINIDDAKSYATEKNLGKALDKAGLSFLRPVVVRNREGRYTAIFSVGMANREKHSPTIPAFHGFPII